MRKTIHAPKGSYHSFCKKLYGIQDDQQKNFHINLSRKKRNIQSVRTQRNRKIDEFSDFKQYMKTIQNRKKFNNQEEDSKGYDFYKSARTERIQKKERRDNNNLDSKKRKNQNMGQIVGPFLPFFKIKIQRQQKQNNLKNFIIDNKKFKLKSLLIQQNKLVGEKWIPIV